MNTKLLKPIWLAAILLLLCALPFTASAYDFMINGIAYNYNHDSSSVTVTYTKYNSSSNYSGLTTVNIPSSVKPYDHTYAVTSIGSSAFYGCTGLRSVTIPNSVNSIADHAFYGCTRLTSITIPNSVNSIGIYAFYQCTGLTSVTIGNSVITIGEKAFFGCTGLKGITIPNSVTSIGLGAFASCSGLTGVLTIPNSVTAIDESAFNACSGLTSVTIGNSVKSIGDYAFGVCSGLTSINIPYSVTSIGYKAFINCSSLTSITIPISVTSIGGNVFTNCSGLKRVRIGAIKIGSEMFKSCTNLSTLTLDSTVSIINNRAFAGCYNLSRIVSYIKKPNSVTYYTSNGTEPTFSSVSNNCKVYVPLESINLYKSSEQWKKFINIFAIASSISLNKNTFSMTIGNTETLSATVLPEGADTQFSWTSSDPSIATVDQNGTVTAKGPGSTTIWATTGDEAASASCNVTVCADDVEDFETMPTTTSTSAQDVEGHWANWSFIKCNVVAPSAGLCDGSQAVAMKSPSSIESSDTYYDACQLSVKVFNQTSTDAKLTLSYSVDGGDNWKVAKSETGSTSITISKNSTATPTWVLSTNKTVATRYRIQQTAGNQNNPIYIDNITIFYTAKGTPPPIPPIIEDFETMPTTTSTSVQNVIGRWANWSFTKCNVDAPGSGMCYGSHSVAMTTPSRLESSDTYFTAFKLSTKVFNTTNTDAKLTLTYSTDGGGTWTTAKTESNETVVTIKKNSTDSAVWVISSDKNVPTRYRIQQTAGNKNNPIYLDDITLFYTASGTQPQRLEDFETMPITGNTSAQDVEGHWANWSFTKCNVVALAQGAGLCNGWHAVAMKLPSLIASSDTYYDAYCISAQVFNTTNTDAKLTLAYSTDGGNTWTTAKSQSNETAVTVKKNSTDLAAWVVSSNKNVPTRYRIQQTAGNKNNPIYLDDVTLYYTPFEKTIEGDVNGDDKVNVSDVTALINMILGVIPKDMTRADVNGDGKINVSDVTALVNIILGVI